MRWNIVAVTGDSMLPALRPGDRLLVVSGVPVRPGDVVVARHGDLLIVKRLFGRADGGWWLESDNQRAPGQRDSWHFGAVQQIEGRVVARYWPSPRLMSRSAST